MFEFAEIVVPPRLTVLPLRYKSLNLKFDDPRSYASDTDGSIGPFRIKLLVLTLAATTVTATTLLVFKVC